MRRYLKYLHLTVCLLFGMLCPAFSEDKIFEITINEAKLNSQPALFDERIDRDGKTTYVIENFNFINYWGKAKYAFTLALVKDNMENQWSAELLLMSDANFSGKMLGITFDTGRRLTLKQLERTMMTVSGIQTTIFRYKISNASFWKYFYHGPKPLAWAYCDENSKEQLSNNKHAFAAEQYQQLKKCSGKLSALLTNLEQYEKYKIFIAEQQRQQRAKFQRQQRAKAEEERKRKITYETEEKKRKQMEKEQEELEQNYWFKDYQEALKKSLELMTESGEINIQKIFKCEIENFNDTSGFRHTRMFCQFVSAGGFVRQANITISLPYRKILLYDKVGSNRYEKRYKTYYSARGALVATHD